jgi:hypothetical protein
VPPHHAPRLSTLSTTPSLESTVLAARQKCAYRFALASAAALAGGALPADAPPAAAALAEGTIPADAAALAGGLAGSLALTAGTCSGVELGFGLG